MLVFHGFNLIDLEGLYLSTEGEAAILPAGLGPAAIHCWRACSRRNGRSFPAANERRDAQCSPRYRPCGRRASTARSCT